MKKILSILSLATCLFAATPLEQALSFMKNETPESLVADYVNIANQEQVSGFEIDSATKVLSITAAPDSKSTLVFKYGINLNALEDLLKRENKNLDLDLLKKSLADKRITEVCSKPYFQAMIIKGVKISTLYLEVGAEPFLGLEIDKKICKRYLK